MQGVFVDFERPPSKKAIKEALADNPKRVSVEATSMFGNEYDGPVTGMPDGKIAFVGPNPHTKRNFYGSIIRSGDTFKVE